MEKNSSIVHIITGLGDGGAEAVLYRICLHDNNKNNEHLVISLTGEGKYGPLLKEHGIKVYALEMTPGKISIKGLVNLYKLIKKIKPDVVQTWMYHSDLIGGLIARLAGIKRVFWNIRHTTLEDDISKKSTILVAKLCAMLSGRIPYKIVCCAQSSYRVHAAMGYKENKLVVITNGYELGKFIPNIEMKDEFRKELSAGDSVILGMVGRYDPLKDHGNLLNAVRIVKDKIPNFICVLVGKGLSLDNKTLCQQIDRLKLFDTVYLLGQRSDIPKIMNGLDIHILSSMSEGFPNVLAEAMACGTPCVTTDVGDAAAIVGSTGWIVEVKNSEALAGAILSAMREIVDLSYWTNKEKACREHIVSNFSIDKMLQCYNSLWFSDE